MADDSRIEFLNHWMQQVGINVPDRFKQASGQLAGKLKSYADASDFFFEEAEKAESGGAVLAACISAGAAIEAALMALCVLNEPDVLTSGMMKRRRAKGLSPSYEQLQLSELADVSRELGWIPDEVVSEKWKTTLKQESNFLNTLMFGSQGNKTLPKAPGEALLKFLQIMRNSVHAPRFVTMDRKPTDREVRDACYIAYLAALELRICIATQLYQQRSRAENLLPWA